MHYVYRIQSEKYPPRNYTGYTANLRKRLEDHNAGRGRYTAPFRPWALIFYAAFKTPQLARAFEEYLKTDSGVAFGNKRLWELPS